MLWRNVKISHRSNSGPWSDTSPQLKQETLLFGTVVDLRLFIHAGSVNWMYSFLRSLSAVALSFFLSTFPCYIKYIALQIAIVAPEIKN